MRHPDLPASKGPPDERRSPGAIPVPLAWLFLASSACVSAGAPPPASGTQDSGGTSDSQALPSAWGYESTHDADPVTAGDMEAALAAFVVRIPTTLANPVISSYFEARSLGTDGCPGEVVVEEEGVGTVSTWQGVCQTPDGITFNGPMTVWIFDGVSLSEADRVLGRGFPEDDLSYTGKGLRGQTDIFSADGSADFNCSCTAIQAEGHHEDGRQAWHTVADGPTHWDGSAAEGTWMEEGIQSGLEAHWIRFPTGRVEFYASGSLEGFYDRFSAGEAGLRVDRDPTMGSCVMQGYLRIRDIETARWYEFAVNQADGDLTCSTCVEDEELGSVCLNFQDLVDFEEKPW